MLAQGFSKLLAFAAVASALAAMTSSAKADMVFQATIGNTVGPRWSGESVSAVHPVRLLTSKEGYNTLTQLFVDPDPGFALADSFVDSRALSSTVYDSPLAFFAVYTLPAPLIHGRQYIVTARLSVTATAFPNQTAIMTNDSNWGPNIMLNQVGNCPAGIDLGGAGLGIITNNTASESYRGTSTFVASEGCDATLEAYVIFLSNGGGSAYSMTESLWIEEIPEPASAGLFGTWALCMLMAYGHLTGGRAKLPDSVSGGQV